MEIKTTKQLLIEWFEADLYTVTTIDKKEFLRIKNGTKNWTGNSWVKLSDLINWIEELREKSDSPQKQILLLYIESELKKRS